MRSFATLLVASLAASLPACGGEDSTPPSTACPQGQHCDSSKLLGTPHPKNADGSVGVTVDEAWPGRPPEPAPLDAAELAAACAALAACTPVEQPDMGTVEELRHLLFAVCLDVSGSYFFEERAIPTVDKNERWTFEARAVIEASGCDAINAVGTPRAAEIYCEEAGCWWSSPTLPIPTVTCDGDVATLATGGKAMTRDCSRSLGTCSETSPTGCTDRAPVACEHPADDRCDGTVRLGCDGTGKVSFHDCSRVPGGTCGEREDNSLGCIYPVSDCGLLSTCSGDVLEKVCSLDTEVQVDCAAMGLGCAEGLCVAP